MFVNRRRVLDERLSAMRENEGCRGEDSEGVEIDEGCIFKG